MLALAAAAARAEAPIVPVPASVKVGRGSLAVGNRTALSADPGDIGAQRAAINFADLVSCQAITLLREAGLSLAEIRRAEAYFGNLYRLPRPFAYRQFWSSSQDVVGRWEHLLISGNRGGGRSPGISFASG